MISRKTAVAIGALVVVVLFGSSATTGALWNDRVTFDAGELRAGDLSILIGDQDHQLSSYSFTALAGSQLRPGDWVQAPLTISNGGTIPLNYRLLTVSASDPTLGEELELNARIVEDEQSCPVGLNAGPPSGTSIPVYAGPLADAATTEDRAIDIDGMETWCIRVNLLTDAPQSQTTTATFTFEATVQ